MAAGDTQILFILYNASKYLTALIVLNICLLLIYCVSIKELSLLTNCLNYWLNKLRSQLILSCLYFLITFRLTTLYMNNKSISNYVLLSNHYVRDVLCTSFDLFLTVFLRDGINYFIRWRNWDTKKLYGLVSNLRSRSRWQWT